MGPGQLLLEGVHTTSSPVKASKLPGVPGSSTSTGSAAKTTQPPMPELYWISRRETAAATKIQAAVRGFLHRGPTQQRALDVYLGITQLALRGRLARERLTEARVEREKLIKYREMLRERLEIARQRTEAEPFREAARRMYRRQLEDEWKVSSFNGGASLRASGSLSLSTGLHNYNNNNTMATPKSHHHLGNSSSSSTNAFNTNPNSTKLEKCLRLLRSLRAVAKKINVPLVVPDATQEEEDAGNAVFAFLEECQRLDQRKQAALLKRKH